jgi:hypothetical protein
MVYYNNYYKGKERVAALAIVEEKNMNNWWAQGVEFDERRRCKNNVELLKFGKRTIVNV